MHLGQTDNTVTAVGQSPESLQKQSIFQAAGYVLTLPQRIVCTALGHPQNVICGETGLATLGRDILVTVALNGAVWYGVYRLVTKKG